MPLHRKKIFTLKGLFSQIEREVIQLYPFDSLYHARNVFQRYFHWHKTIRRRHALGRNSPLEYWHTAFPCHPVRPPKALSEDFVKDDDTFKNVKNKYHRSFYP